MLPVSGALQLQASGAMWGLRPMISATPEQVEQYYFRTDHHWNFTGAFLSFQQIVDRLDTLLPVELAQKVVGKYQTEAITDSPLESPYRDLGWSLEHESEE